MNAANKVTIKSVDSDDASLPLVIHDSMLHPSSDKILEVIKSYVHPDHEIMGAFMDDILVGILGIYKTSSLITMRHISVLQDFQRQGVGTLLLDEIKKRYAGYSIIACEDCLTEIGWLLSWERQACVDASGNFIPWYSYAVINFLSERLCPDSKIFEFGAGYSSIFYAQHGAAVISIEKDPIWYTKITQLREQLALDNLYVHLVALPQEFAGSIQKFDCQDIIVVDSMCRNDCVAISYQKLSIGGVIILDNSERSKYQSSFELLTSLGFRHINFSGIGPLRVTSSQTTIFYREENILGL